MNEKLLLVAGVTALAMLSPGPDMLLVMRNTLAGDRRRGGLTALGVLTGNLIHITYCTLGIALLLSRSPLAYNVLRVASAIYLIYLGIQSLWSRGAVKAEPDSSADRRATNAYWQGLVNNVLNPKGSLFFLGVFSQLITPDMSFAQTTLLVGVMLSISTVFWIVFVQTLQLPMIRVGLAKSTVAINRVFGAVLILFGARVAMLK
jgi:threonine/homoserine/homoserine lactone efflux protein